MREFVGVKSPLDLIIEIGSRSLPVERVLKREALMFHRIACPQLGRAVSAFERLGDLAQPISNQLLAHVDYLKQNDVIFDDVSSASGLDLDILNSDVEFQKLTSVEEPIADSLIQNIRNSGLEEVLKAEDVTLDEMLPHLDQIPSVISSLVFASQFIVRKLSIQLRVLNEMDAYPVYSEVAPAIPIQHPQKCDVIDIAIKALPMPDDDVPWEKVIEYRSDPESQAKLLALRRWMGKMIREELSPAEVEVELEYLIDQYRRHMKVHRMKTKNRRLETIVMAGANFVSFKWGEAAQTLFSSKRLQVELLEGELTAPGNEVAYIVNAWDEFGVS